MALHLLPPQILIFSFFFGICVGSFLNVVIARVPEGKSIVHPGSHCPACKANIPFYLNIPILSYIILKGKCSSCRKTIAIRYPLVEFITGILAAGACLKYGPGLPGLFIFAFGATLIAISFIDIDHQIIPDVISLPGILVFLSAPFFLPEMTLIRSISGVLIGGGILYSVALVYYLLKGQHGMGGGDIKLLAMIGAAIGPKGVLFTLFAGSVLGTLIGGAVILNKKSPEGSPKRQIKLPFGPFLSMGAIVYIFWGEQLMQWYARILNGGL